MSESINILVDDKLGATIYQETVYEMLIYGKFGKKILILRHCSSFLFFKRKMLFSEKILRIGCSRNGSNMAKCSFTPARCHLLKPSPAMARSHFFLILHIEIYIHIPSSPFMLCPKITLSWVILSVSQRT